MPRVAIKPLIDSEPVKYGLLLGLYLDNGCDRCGSDSYVAVVQLDGMGMVVSLIHPSRVVLLSDSGRD
jgi:hypothetical protein